MKTAPQSTGIWLLTAIIVSLVFSLSIKAQPHKADGEPLSAYSTGAKGIRALYLLAKRLKMRPVIHNRPLVLIPRGAFVVLTGSAKNQSHKLFAPYPFYDLQSITSQMEKGTSFLLLMPLPNETVDISSTGPQSVKRSKVETKSEKNDKNLLIKNESIPNVEAKENMLKLKSNEHGARESDREVKISTNLHNIEERRAEQRQKEQIHSKIYEVAWEKDEKGGMHIFLPKTSALFNEVTHIYIKRNIEELEYVSTYYQNLLDSLDEVYILKGTLVPLLGAKSIESARLTILFISDILTNEEIGLVDNVVFANNLLQLRGEMPLYFFHENARFYLPTVSVTSLLVSTKGGRALSILILIALVALLPRVFPLGRRLSLPIDKFPPETERIIALGNQMYKTDDFEGAFLFALSALSGKSPRTDNEQLNLLAYLTNEIEMSDEEFIAIQRILRENGELNRTEREFIISVYSKLLRKKRWHSSI